MPFAPVDLGQVENQAAAATVRIHEQNEDGLDHKWTPLFKAECTFDAGLFEKVMLNLIKNPNLNSSWLFRADILFDQQGSEVSEAQQQSSAFQCPMKIPEFEDLTLTRLLVRRMIPRNALRDKALDQTCVFYTSSSSHDTKRSLILYLPHVRSEMDVPFYHPPVRGIAFLHDWSQAEAKGTVSTHYLFFESSSCIPAVPFDLEDADRAERPTRTGLHLLRILHKHGEGEAAGYKKRVHHDVLVPQITLQTKYADLKQKYSRQLVEEWEEVTDPTKHVFEDLCIAAFLIELWSEMYKDTDFPGFVDIGCGNGLLVHILHREGYTGWGFDARARKSWPKYSSKVAVRTIDGGHHIQDSLQTLVLLPSVTRNTGREEISDSLVHDGCFPKDTFIISNHADELTPWTPILARLSDCPFMMIPCCSHTLTGNRFRAPPPQDKAASKSTYSSLCGWVTEIAKDCGWLVEKEILRIPSTRNTAFIGRRLTNSADVDVQILTAKYGGVAGYYENVVKLLKASSARGH
ncbi:tRNA(Ser) Um(44) 2'-O-methyltransferase [Gnomoniopsis smithogilvyi]|uniref:tRNA (uracil-O(2)-)-methyltransferase n=1 Tax=Gnomoniopsis smithogilvyi TaxID=1191159 RepID=A0A9W9CSW7_9PEZI|nr:tRNA(Ser) Um(44) 2'-O-methyltransferase [Gnomoniopsis smithogilvyi]